MRRTFHFSPTSHAFFIVNCLRKDCVDGGFDLTQVITEMIRNRRMEGKVVTHAAKAQIPPPTTRVLFMKLPYNTHKWLSLNLTIVFIKKEKSIID